MLRTLLLSISALLTSGVCLAGTAYRDVTVTTAGTLAEALGDDIGKVDSLVVIGPINDADFYTLWRAAFHGRMTVANLEYAVVENGTVPENAFWHKDEQRLPGEPLTKNHHLRRVILPEGVEAIGDYAFQCASYLERVDLPKSLRKIGRGAFAVCTSLKTYKMHFPEGLDEIPDECFRDCATMREITLPSTIRHIGQRAFENTHLWSVNFPEGLESIGHRAFRNTSLQEVILPASCTEFTGEDQFSVTNHLKRLEVKGAVKAIPPGFVSYSGLEEFTMPSTVETIGRGAFRDSELKSISLPEGLKSIGDRAFRCTSLQEVILPASCTEFIGEYQFSVTNHLKRLEVKGAVKAIPPGFAAYSGLKEFTVPSTVETIGCEAFRDCLDLKSITLPEGLKEIKDGAFYWCTALEELTFPSTLTFLGEGSCQQLKSLKAIRCLCTTPPECGITEGNNGGTPFICFAINSNSSSSSKWEGMTSMDVPLYVPEGTKELYRADWRGWGYFFNIIETDFTGISNITTDHQPADGECHDLFGRKVTNPAPGQVLIRNGKKVMLR